MLQVETFTFLPQAFAEHSYVVSDDSGKCVVIDPGCYLAHEQKELSDYLDQKGLELEKILLTHAHIDHIYGLKYLKDKYGAPILCHELERFNLERAAQHSMLFGLQMENPPMPDTWLGEEDSTLTFGNTTFQILFTPGHSPGHISFHSPENKQLFSGDVIFRDSFGRTDLPGGSMDTLRKTIKETILTLHPETTIYAGHLGLTTVGREARTNPMVTGF